MKGVIARNWGNRKQNSKTQSDLNFYSKCSPSNVAFISNDIKTSIRKVLPEFLTHYQNKVFRSQIDEVIRLIAKHDFPESFQPLYEYFFTNLKAFNELIASNNPPDFLSDAVFNFFRTMNFVIKEQIRRRKHNSKDLFYACYFNLLGGFSSIWTTFTSNFKNLLETVLQSKNDDNLERFLVLVRTFDKIVLNLLACGFDEIHTE